MLHEKLICYRKSIILAEELGHAVSRWPKGYGYLSDQLKRAMSSVVLNCAEGNARTSSKERTRFFQIARASMAEVGACLDLMGAFRLISKPNQKKWKTSSHEISKMLHALT